jgi:tRNA(Leu) C34 or U34 (ribose-2'-O)-methylase TrmL
MNAGVLLISPKFPHNVGGALRAAACLDADALYWTGKRVPAPERWPKGARLPREERIRAYQRVHVEHVKDSSKAFEQATLFGGFLTPIAVELRASAEDLRGFEHPENALYVFGPEDSSLGRAELVECHRFVRIPSDGCLNLAAAVNVVLYDRLTKLGRRDEAALARAGFDGA